MSRSRFWRRSKSYRPVTLLQQLEERIVLDAAVNPAPQDNTNNQPDGGLDHSSTGDQAPAPADAGGHPDGNAGLAASVPDSYAQVFNNDLNVVLVANNLADVDAISHAAQGDAKVITYDAEHDNLATITAKLQDLVAATGHKIDNLAIVGHSSDGVLSIGTDQIQFFTLSNYQATFQTLGQTLTQDAQIQFYGCYLADSVWGEAMVDRIAIYTSADAFASTDATGGAGQDWTLEHASNSGVAMNNLFDTAALASVTTELFEVHLIADTNSATSSNPSSFVLVNGHILFVANGTGTGTELWEYDPGTNTNSLFMDINPGIGSSNPALFKVIGNNVYFTATSSTAVGAEPWISDGTAAGTHMIKNIYPANGQGSIASGYTEFNGEVYFSALNDIGQRELFKTDGTEAGTFEVTRDLAPSFSGANHPIVFNGELYFVAASDGSNFELWKTNGTPGNFTQVTDIAGTSPDIVTFGRTVTVLNNELYFVANDGSGAELWKTNGTFDNETRVKDINPGSGSGLSAGTYQPVEFNNELYFAATDGTGVGFFGAELWKTNGTEAGTVRVTDINLNQASSSPANLTVLDNDGPGPNAARLYFTATNGAANGVELWSTNGTPGNQIMVADIAAGAGSGINPTNAFLTVLGNSLYFQANDGTTAGLHGAELWKVSASGIADDLVTTTVDESLTTQMVQDLNLGISSSSPQNIANLGGTLYFGANNGVGGVELFKSDGTTITPTPDINLGGTATNAPSNYFNVNGQVFFIAQDASHGYELWVTDGTEAGTHLVKDILPGSNPINPPTMNFTAFNNMLYFTATDGVNGTELWRSDGTEAGTVMVADIAAGSASSNPGNLTVFNNGFSSWLYFSATNGSGVNGIELWRTDGTPGALIDGHTEMVADIAAGTGSSSPADLKVFNNNLYFTATDGIGVGGHGRELWHTNGFQTAMVADINPGTASSIGTNAANNPLPNLTVFNNELFFIANDGTHGYELWKTDGASDPTMLPEIRPGASTAFGGNNVANPAPTFTIVDDTLFFIANDGTSGYQLWASNGSTSEMLTDFPGTAPFSSTNPGLIAYNHELFFIASDGSFGPGAHGSELWKSDGTADGTVMVKDIFPGSGNGANAFGVPTFQTLNGTLYFTANDGVNGTALWGTKGTEASTQMVSDIDPATNSGIYPRWMTAVGGALYFSTNDGINGPEPWKMTNTPATATNLNQGPYTIAEDSGPLDFANIDVFDADPTDIITASLTLDVPAAGTLSSSGGVFDPVTGIWTISGNEAVVDAALANLAFTPGLNFNGTVNITTQVFDNAVQGPADGLITVNVTPVNDAPVNTVPALVTVNEDVLTPITGISISDDAGANPIVVVLNVSHGTLLVDGTVLGGLTAGQIAGNGTGSIILTATLAEINATLANATGLQYQSALNYNGPDTLTVFTDDVGATGTGGPLMDLDTVPITVNPVNDAPTTNAEINQTHTVAEDSGALNLNNIVVSDVDAGDTITATLTLTDPLSGALSANDGASYSAGTGVWSISGSLAAVNTALANVTFTPALNFNGDATITTHVQDAAVTGPADGLITVHVTPVDDAPVNTVPVSATAITDVLTPITGISISDVDAGASSVQVTLSVTQGTLHVSDSVAGGLTAAGISGNDSGSVVLNGTLAAINATLADAAGLQYQSNLGYSGPDTLTVLSNDLGATGSGGPLTDLDTVDIAVNSTDVNDPPAISLSAEVQQTDPSGAVVFSAANGNLIAISDPDAGTGLVQVTLTATHGTLTLSGVAGLTFNLGQDGTADATMTFTGTLTDINAALNGMSFHRDAGYTGLADVTINVNDQGNTGPGGPQSAISVANLSVEPYDTWFAGFGSEAGWNVYNYAAGGTAYYTHDHVVFWQHVNATDTWNFYSAHTGWVTTDALNNAPYADGFGPYATWFTDTTGGTYDGYRVFIGYQYGVTSYFSLDETAPVPTFWQLTNAGNWSYYDGSAWYATAGFLVEPVNVWFHDYDGIEAGWDSYNYPAGGSHYFTHDYVVYWQLVDATTSWFYYNGTAWVPTSGLGITA